MMLFDDVEIMYKPGTYMPPDDDEEDWEDEDDWDENEDDEDDWDDDD